MTVIRPDARRSLSVLLAFFFLAAQIGALAHSYEHEPGKPLSQVCATCIAGHAVGSACIDSTPNCMVQTYKDVTGIDQVSALNSIEPPLARQRAPPTPL